MRLALRTHGLAWREDRTNQDRTFARNWVRAEVLPLLEIGIAHDLNRKMTACEKA